MKKSPKPTRRKTAAEAAAPLAGDPAVAQQVRAAADQSSTRWWKLVVHYSKPSECNSMALATAIRLRDTYPGVYFARYTSATYCRAEFTVQCFTDVTPGRQAKQVAQVIEKFALSNLSICALPKIDEAVSHNGSEAHAKAFDVVFLLAKHFCLCPDKDSDDEALFYSPSEINAALADVVHWMHNMLGVDYVAEARQYLYGIDRILTIFNECINAPTNLKEN